MTRSSQTCFSAALLGYALACSLGAPDLTGNGADGGTSSDGGLPSDGDIRSDGGTSPGDGGACTASCTGKMCGSADGCNGICEQGSGCSAGVWRPPPGIPWQWQLTGVIDTSVDVPMYDVDLFDVPQATIDTLQGQGRTVICYFSAGSWEDWRTDASEFPAAALGSNNGWPGEKWLDTRDGTVREIMKRRLDLAVQKGCDGVEPDNVDGYVNSTGFPLTYATQLSFNRFIADEAHARSLSVGLKNDVDQVQDLVSSFDWALSEECHRYDECSAFGPFVDAGKAVFHVEYGGASLADTVCPATKRLGLSSMIKRLDLDAWRVPCP